MIVSTSPFLRSQKEKFALLAEKMDQTAESEGALPRDDYRYLLNLIKVSFFLLVASDSGL